jgi:hypothetical protein
MKEFEELIEEINGQGFYQKRLLYFVLSPLFFFLPLSWLNELFLLHVPSHWCYHPSQDNLNPARAALRLCRPMRGRSSVASWAGPSTSPSSPRQCPWTTSGSAKIRISFLSSSPMELWVLFW